MAAATSPATGEAYGVKRVCTIWGVARSSFYDARHQEVQPGYWKRTATEALPKHAGIGWLQRSQPTRPHNAALCPKNRVQYIDILVAERDRNNPLADQCRQRVDELPWIAAVAEACRHTLDQPDRPASRAARLPRHPTSPLRRRMPPPRDDHRTLRIRADRRYTLSASDPAPESINPLSQKDDLRFLGPMHLPR